MGARRVARIGSVEAPKYTTPFRDSFDVLTRPADPILNYEASATHSSFGVSAGFEGDLRSAATG